MGVAPDFTLTGQDGKTYSLKDFTGKIVVLEWFNNDCPYVEKHYGTDNMQKLQENTRLKVLFGSVFLRPNLKMPSTAKNSPKSTQIENPKPPLF
ncbi:MAG: redoxin domain-containing protein [Bdellovibrionota bacterium]